MSKRTTGEGPNPSGLCECGCGRRTPIAKRSDATSGVVIGTPVRFIQGHSGHHGQNKKTGAGPNPSGLCMCGCGEDAPVAVKSNRRTGDVFGKPMRYVVGHQRRKSALAVVVDEVSGCHVWQRTIDHTGYGQVRIKGRLRRAHVVAWQSVHGPVPDGHVVHHECRNKSCVNVEHLRAMPRAEHLNMHGLERWSQWREARGACANDATHSLSPTG